MLLNLTFNILTSFSKNFLCTNVLQAFSHHNLFSVAKTKVDYSAGAVSFLSLAFHVVVFTQCFVFVLFFGMDVFEIELMIFEVCVVSAGFIARYWCGSLLAV